MSALERNLGFLLHDVARLMRKRFEQSARQSGLGLTRSQWQVLAHLAKHEGIQQGALADLLEIEPITLVRILDKLQELDLVERRPHATDRRIWLLYLKPSAGPVLDTMWTIGDRTRAEALEHVSSKDRDHLMQALFTMRENLLAACSRANED
ncbi:MarR family winged helix-turn-helix transcriptional regulator [Microvirga massiliensis]|uniref:MarR family winged helix-turn-helix transcriptional regulator n=1 Tax=Microvirga massiliensis TaxID=1033741 RepID=UPI00062B3AA4|nr:MarR family transcriptional regulator [Microvirga massiliensis]